MTGDNVIYDTYKKKKCSAIIKIDNSMKVIINR